jgi:hypothetical protein
VPEQDILIERRAGLALRVWGHALVASSRVSVLASWDGLLAVGLSAAKPQYPKVKDVLAPGHLGLKVKECRQECRGVKPEVKVASSTCLTRSRPSCWDLVKQFAKKPN